MVKKKEILEDIDRILQAGANPDLKDVGWTMGSSHQILGEEWQQMMMMQACIRRYTKPGSSYRESIAPFVTAKMGDRPDLNYAKCKVAMHAFRADVEAGCLADYETEIVTNTFTGLLDQATELNRMNFIQPAAVLAGAALEEHLHFLCERHDIGLAKENGKPRSASDINNALKASGVYPKQAHKVVDSWQATRNRSTHPPKEGESLFCDEFDTRDIRRMIEGITDFIGKGYENSPTDQ